MEHENDVRVTILPVGSSPRLILDRLSNRTRTDEQ
jgi:hypothetical protein